MKQEQDNIKKKRKKVLLKKKIILEMKTSMKRLEDIPASKETKNKNVGEKR